MKNLYKTIFAVIGALTAIAGVLLLLKKLGILCKCKCCCSEENDPETVEDFVEEATEKVEAAAEEACEAVEEKTEEVCDAAEKVAEEFKDYADVELPKQD